jgi:tartrate dehydratase alpha subunit/fumarate hydratase class I-like protein
MEVLFNAHWNTNLCILQVKVNTKSCFFLTGNEHGRGFRDLEMEQKIHELTQRTGIGAQFGGKYFCHDVRVVRLPRHGASCPVGIGVSCSADRQVSTEIICIVQ